MGYKEQIEQAKHAAEKWREKHWIVGVGELRVDCMVDDLTRSITDLLARAEAAEARVEKAERERDAAVSDMEALMCHSGDGCNICAHSVEAHRVPYVRLTCYLKGNCEPKWRGIKEE